MIIDLDLYRVFVAVATNGSFSKAAEELSVTQSAVSQSISKLETIFEKELFVRGRQGTVLTTFGKKVLEEVEPSIKELDNVYEKVNISSSQPDTINIAASGIICDNILLPIFARHYRDKHFYLDSILSDKDKIRGVQSGKLDMAIINDYNLPIDSGLFKKKLLTLTYDFYYNPDKVNVDNLFDNTLIIKNGGTKGRVEFNKKYYSMPFKFKNLLELSHDEIIIRATEMGMGVGFCPDLYTRDRNLKRLELGGDKVKKDIVLIYGNKNNLANCLADEIINTYKK